MRYREKKLRRLDSNTIRYMKRKINADKRPRCARVMGVNTYAFWQVGPFSVIGSILHPCKAVVEVIRRGTGITTVLTPRSATLPAGSRAAS